MPIINKISATKQDLSKILHPKSRHTNIITHNLLTIRLSSCKITIFSELKGESHKCVTLLQQVRHCPTEMFTSASWNEADRLVGQRRHSFELSAISINEMNEEIKDRNQLINLLAKHPIKPKRIFGLNCNHAQFSEWSKVDTLILHEMAKIGELNIQAKKAMNTNYWGSGSPIEIDKYPYCNCEIFICEKCNNIFFYYTEHGGHSAEKRMRLIKESAIVNKDDEYYMNLAIPRSIECFHDILKEDFNFPEFYGANWDAFWDTITGIVELPKTVTFYNYDVFLRNWKDKAKILNELVDDYNNQSNCKIQLVNGMINLN